jgi:Arc/MetJ-type ribon-helix-helix transcriptional regulator
MSDNVRELRPKVPETEKITVNLGYVDLGQVDLMVQEGFYSNRTDFIRTAIRNQLERHPDLVKDHDDSALDVSASFARPKAPIAQFASTRIRRRGSPRRWRCHA